MLRTSGECFLPIALASDAVEGMVFAEIEAELTKAGRYDVSDYKRVEVFLKSGIKAWVYVKS